MQADIPYNDIQDLDTHEHTLRSIAAMLIKRKSRLQGPKNLRNPRSTAKVGPAPDPPLRQPVRNLALYGLVLPGIDLQQAYGRGQAFPRQLADQEFYAIKAVGSSI